jgi:hypothetical protein
MLGYKKRAGKSGPREKHLCYKFRKNATNV